MDIRDELKQLFDKFTLIRERIEFLILNDFESKHDEIRQLQHQLEEYGIKIRACYERLYPIPKSVESQNTIEKETKESQLLGH